MRKRRKKPLKYEGESRKARRGKGKHSAAPLRQQLISGIFVLLFLVGFGVLIYPTVANQWNTWRQSRLLTTYKNAVSAFSAQDLSAYWEAAKVYNDALEGSVLTDPFSDSEDLEDTEYWQALNVNGDGIMGYISIPKINVKLAIYHGTSDEVLQTGIGHIAGSGLPIGGKGNHTVLAGHRGLPSARLFTDIDQLEIGDVFYLYVLDEVLAYEVDRILPMVEKEDGATLEQALSAAEGEDYVTLFTCTPYGVNTHRLLVRGTRIPYEEQEETRSTAVVGAILQAIRDYYMLYILLGMGVTILVIIISRGILNRKYQDDEM